MKTNLWSMKTGLALLAGVLVAVVLIEHLREVEIAAKPERDAADHVIRGASPADSAIGNSGSISNPSAISNPGSDPSDSDASEEANLETAIRASAAAFTELFNDGDAAGIAALWTADGDYVDAAGDRFIGRQAIERQYARFFEEHPGARIQIQIDTIRPLGDDAAIEDGHASLLPREPGAPASSPYTVIHGKIDGRWLMASVHEPAAEQAASNDPLRSLDWLVGSWRAEGPNGKMVVQFRWVAGHSFLERTYSVEQRDRITTSGVQLIGRDVASGELQSWSFTSDAGYAVGSWIALPDGWSIVTRGKLPDGTITRAVNYLTRLNENTLSWQSRERKTGETSLPDTDAVRLTRIVDGE